MHWEGADGNNDNLLNIGDLFYLLLSRWTAGLQVLRDLHEWMQDRNLSNLSGLRETSGRRLQPWVPMEEVVKTSTLAGKGTLTPPAVKAEERPPPAAPAQLNLGSDDNGRVRGQMRSRQPGPSSPSWSSSFTTSSSEVKEVHPNLPKPPKNNKSGTKRKGQTIGQGHWEGEQRGYWRKRRSTCGEGGGGWADEKG